MISENHPTIAKGFDVHRPQRPLLRNSYYFQHGC